MSAPELTDEQMGIVPELSDEQMGYVPEADNSSSQSNAKNRIFGAIDLVGDLMLGAKWVGKKIWQGVDPHTMVQENMKLLYPDRYPQEDPGDPYMQSGARGTVATLAGAFGAHPPQTSLDRAQAESMKNVIYAAPFAAMAAPAGPIAGPLLGTAMLAEATFNPFAKRALDQKIAAEQGPNPTPGQRLMRGVAVQGAGLAMSLGVGIASDSIAKTVINSRNTRTAAKLLDDASPEVLSGLDDLADAITENVRLRFGDAAENAPTFTRMDIVQGSQEVKRILKSSPFTDIDLPEEMLPFLDRAAEAFPSGYGASTVQAVPNRVSRQYLQSVDTGLADVGPIGDEYVRIREMQNEGFMRSLESKWQEMTGGLKGGPDDVRDLFVSAGTQLHEKASLLYDSKIYDGTVDAANYADEIADVINKERSSVYSGWLKGYADKLDGVLDPQDLETIRRDLLAIENAPIVSLGEGGTVKSVLAGNLRRIVDKMWDDMPEATNASAKEARAAWRDYKTFTSVETPGGEVAKLLGNMMAGNNKQVANSVLKSGENMKRALEAVGGQERGVDALRSMSLAKVFDTRNSDEFGNLLSPNKIQIGKAGPTQIRDNIYRYEEALGALWSKEEVDGWKWMADMIERAQAQRIGKTASVYAAKSGGLGARFLKTLSKADDMTRPAVITEKAIQASLAKIENDPKLIYLMQEFMRDPGTAAKFIRVPSKAAIPAYLIHWDMFMKQAAVRYATQAKGYGEITDADFDAAYKALAPQYGGRVDQVPEQAVIKFFTEGQ